MIGNIKELLSDHHSLAIFMIDNNHSDVILIKHMLRDLIESNDLELTFTINSRASLAAGISAIKKANVNLILLNLSLSNGHKGVELIDEIRTCKLFHPIIILSDKEDEHIAIEAVRHGAQDYLVKEEISEKLLIKSIFYALERQKLRIDLKKALEKIDTLHGLLPICAKCKQVKDNHGYWGQIEQYISNHSDLKFTHGYCPKCFDECMEELNQNKNSLQQSSPAESLDPSF